MRREVPEDVDLLLDEPEVHAHRVVVEGPPEFTRGH